MVLLTGLESTAHGLMGSTVDDVVVQLSAPTLNTIDVPRQIDLLDMDKPEVLLRGIRFFCPEPKDHIYWPDWEELSGQSTYRKAFDYFKDATTDPFHFYQVGNLYNDVMQQVESDEELKKKFIQKLEEARIPCTNLEDETLYEKLEAGTISQEMYKEAERIASQFYRKFTTRTVASVAIYREWGLRDPREGEYFKWHKEKERIGQTVERGVEAVFNYVVGCIYGGTLEAEYDTTEPIRNYIARLRQETLEPESNQQKWQAMLDISTRFGPKNKKQEFWPHFKYIHKVVSEKQL